MGDVGDGDPRRQAAARRVIKAGHCPSPRARQPRASCAAGTADATMISFQNPPDLILYTGARDSKRPGAAAPKGVITPGAVKYLNFQEKNGSFTNPEMGSNRASGSHRNLKRGETFHTNVEAEGS